jgi:SNF family Na+-dependent transporter
MKEVLYYKHKRNEKEKQEAKRKNFIITFIVIMFLLGITSLMENIWRISDNLLQYFIIVLIVSGVTTLYSWIIGNVFTRNYEYKEAQRSRRKKNENRK